MNEAMYYTYIVASRSHHFYVVMTSDIEGRLWRHRDGIFEEVQLQSVGLV